MPPVNTEMMLEMRLRMWQMALVAIIRDRDSHPMKQDKAWCESFYLQINGSVQIYWEQRSIDIEIKLSNFMAALIDHNALRVRPLDCQIA